MDDWLQENWRVVSKQQEIVQVRMGDLFKEERETCLRKKKKRFVKRKNARSGKGRVKDLFKEDLEIYMWKMKDLFKEDFEIHARKNERLI